MSDSLFKIYDQRARSFKEQSIKDCKIENNGNLYAIPGFVDVHTHGCLELAFENAGISEIIKMLKFYAESGTLYLMPTIGTVSLDSIYNATQNILCAVKQAKESGELVACVLGIHFECRYLNPIKAGAHSPDLLVNPNIDEARKLIDMVHDAEKSIARKLHVHFTIAPELPGGNEFIKQITQMGATVGIGHSDADCTQAESALKAGAVSFTHLFNALRSIHHRTSSAVTCALTSDAYTEFICDGKHLLPEIAKLIKVAKSKDRVVLISDSVAAGVKQGKSFTFFSGLKVRIQDGIAVLENGTIGGSAIIMQKAAQNYMRFTGASFEDTLLASIANPLAMINMTDYVPLPTSSASFVLIDESFNIKAVYINGNKLTISED